MRKGTLMRLLTIPWWVMMLGTIQATESQPERFNDPLQAIMLLLTVGLCLIMIPAAFWAAHESDVQDQEIIALRKKFK